MGLNNLAVTKFYAVMTSALALKPEKFEYYQKLVLRAQTEIAAVQYDLGNWGEAAESFSRLLALDIAPDIRAPLQRKLIRCLVSQSRNEEAIVQSLEFLSRYPESPDRPEVRFLCATALRREGLLPAVIYGHGSEPLSVHVDQHTTIGALKQGLHVLNLSIEGKGTETCLVKDLQFGFMGDDVIRARKSVAKNQL